MSEIINGKEALIALANGEDVEIKTDVLSPWKKLNQKKIRGLDFYLKDRPNHSDSLQFRLKPRPILINGIEVPTPFEPNEFEDCYMLSDLYAHGYTKTSWKYSKSVPAWRTEDEIKKVVSTLRSIFKGGDVK